MRWPWSRHPITTLHIEVWELGPNLFRTSVWPMPINPHLAAVLVSHVLRELTEDVLPACSDPSEVLLHSQKLLEAIGTSCKVSPKRPPVRII